MNIEELLAAAVAAAVAAKDQELAAAVAAKDQELAVKDQELAAAVAATGGWWEGPV